jgi:predicted AAA+ superfamily ATPase
MIDRPEYLEELKRFKDKDLIKVVTGIRRCGKSTLFDLFCNYLKTIGIKDNQIIRINLENPDFNFANYKELYDYVKRLLVGDKKNYVFIDEVQNVEDFQKACDGLYIMDNVDLYITGSNAYLLSGELATLLSGRYVEIKMLPLSFKEYISKVGSTDLIKKYNNYLLNSSFPYTLSLDSREEILIYLDGIYNTIVLKDVATRKNIIDMSTLQSIIYFMFDNIGNLCSSTKISNTLASNGKKISVPTIEVYLNALVDSFILYKVDRYDIKGKQYLTTGHKYYLPDIGLRYYLLGSKKADEGHILENIVYLELLRRGYKVHIGKTDDNEVDFVAEKESGIEYYQVAYTVHDGKTLERELTPLDAISDHNPKYLITMDFTPNTSHNGIKQINALDWLLN